MEPAGPSRGRVLLSYMGPAYFRLPADSPEVRAHTRVWECRQIAQTFVDLGYTVDVIDWRNDVFIPRHPYRVFIDVRHNMERLAHLLGPNCLKVFHVDVAHMVFRNWAECTRLKALWERRGIVLPVARFEQPNQAIEFADCAVVLGNEFTLGTYRYAGKPLYRIWISCPALYPSPADKDFERCRHRFVWFGSGGFVHKGLDLVLEAFAELPQLELTVCGPIESEEAFRRAYWRELYETPNIHAVGWVDVEGERFREITRTSVAVVYASAAEGQCGAVVNCMHAGLIPVISYESGVDVDGFGWLLRRGTVEEIKEAVLEVAATPAEELRRRAVCAWEQARRFHTREAFARRYRKLAELLLKHGPVIPEGLLADVFEPNPGEGLLSVGAG